MPRDELNEPLRRRSVGARVWSRRPSNVALAGFAAISLLAGSGAYLLASPNPYGGEPVLVLDLPPAKEVETASIATPPAAPVEPPEEPEEAPPQDEPVESYSPGDSQIIDNEAAIIVSPRRSLPPAPIAAVSQEGPYGLLPKIGAGGKRPSNVYARIASASLQVSDAPKIALVLGGMGLNAELTAKAIKTLPGEVSFAFAPYGENLQAQVNKARAAGHEIILQVPMEPFGYPATNPGPKTLLINEATEANLDMLMWHLGRFAGYIGTTGYMGGSFLAEPLALQPILAEMKKRGLVFFEDMPSGRSVVADIGGRVGLPVRATQMVIDSDQNAKAIAKALQALEEDARRSGLAIASGTGLDVTIEEVVEWAKTLNDRGILLVPLSTAYRGKTG